MGSPNPNEANGRRVVDVAVGLGVAASSILALAACGGGTPAAVLPTPAVSSPGVREGSSGQTGSSEELAQNVSLSVKSINFQTSKESAQLISDATVSMIGDRKSFPVPKFGADGIYVYAAEDGKKPVQYVAAAVLDSNNQPTALWIVSSPDNKGTNTPNLAVQSQGKTKEGNVVVRITVLDSQKQQIVLNGGSLDLSESDVNQGRSILTYVLKKGYTFEEFSVKLGAAKTEAESKAIYTKYLELAEVNDPIEGGPIKSNEPSGLLALFAPRAASAAELPPGAVRVKMPTQEPPKTPTAPPATNTPLPTATAVSPTETPLPTPTEAPPTPTPAPTPRPDANRVEVN